MVGVGCSAAGTGTFVDPPSPMRLRPPAAPRAAHAVHPSMRRQAKVPARHLHLRPRQRWALRILPCSVGCFSLTANCACLMLSPPPRDPPLQAAASLACRLGRTTRAHMLTPTRSASPTAAAALASQVRAACGLGRTRMPLRVPWRPQAAPSTCRLKSGRGLSCQLPRRDGAGGMR